MALNNKKIHFLIHSKEDVKDSYTLLYIKENLSKTDLQELITNLQLTHYKEEPEQKRLIINNELFIFFKEF